MIRLLLNGQEREVAEGTTLGALLAELGLESSRVAVERNGEIVPRGEYAATVLYEGDRLEIVHFVGGG